MDVISLLDNSAITRRLEGTVRATRPRPPCDLIFPRSLVEPAAHHLQLKGQRGEEQLALWGGYPTSSGVAIASLLLPQTNTGKGWVRVIPTEQPAIADWLRSHGQLLFAEAHTHGFGLYATEMSDVDRRYPAGRQDGFLTIIIPGFARSGIDVSVAGIWECHSLTWTKLTADEVRRRVRVVADEEVKDALR